MSHPTSIRRDCTSARRARRYRAECNYQFSVKHFRDTVAEISLLLTPELRAVRSGGAVPALQEGAWS